MKLTYYISTIAILFLAFSCNGQDKLETEDSRVSDINEYVIAINSNETLSEGITEGIIENESQSGGFEIYDLYDNESKELLRIRDNEATDTISNISIYYKDNKVVYIKAKKGVWKDGEYSNLFEQEVYFSNEEVIKEVGQGQKAIRLLDIGKEHLRVHNEYNELRK